MNPIDIQQINERLEAFAQDREWNQFHSIKNLAMALGAEAGELLEILQWLTEDQSNAIKDSPKEKTKLEEEVADIFIYLCRIAYKANINLEQAVNKKIELNAKKYPTEIAKGSAKKYSELPVVGE
jgi:dCTP diphosphatase